MSDPDLFSAAGERRRADRAPLAERVRPRSLDEVVGQAHLLGPGRLLREMIDRGVLASLVFWGPPGSGKTTLARLLASVLDAELETISAVLAGVKDIRSAIGTAEKRWGEQGKPTILFVDEIHRFNKAQQDALLPHVERGTVVLFGATTENPSFEIIGPLLSRSRVVVLEPLGTDDLGRLAERALGDTERGLGALGVAIDPKALAALVSASGGDARILLNTLEVAASIATHRQPRTIETSVVAEAAQRQPLLYDKDGEQHHDVVSAFIKSLRDSDTDAALYWCARMIEAGEDPLFIARRMVVLAAEDIGLADPRALSVASSVKDAVHFVGMPEARIPLAMGVAYLATAPKSNRAFVAIERALADAREHGALPVPLVMRNAPTNLMKDLGYGKGYQYAHDAPGATVDQKHRPDALEDRRYYEPSDRGYEGRLRSRRVESSTAHEREPEGNRGISTSPSKPKRK